MQNSNLAVLKRPRGRMKSAHQFNKCLSDSLLPMRPPPCSVLHWTGAWPAGALDCTTRLCRCPSQQRRPQQAHAKFESRVRAPPASSEQPSGPTSRRLLLENFCATRSGLFLVSGVPAEWTCHFDHVASSAFFVRESMYN